MSTGAHGKRGVRWALYAALGLLYLLHNDLWLWRDARLILGLPVGLVYHVGFCLVTSIVLALLVRWAWPSAGNLGISDPDDA